MKKDKLNIDINILPDWQRKWKYSRLQAWFNTNNVDDKMVYKKSFEDQLLFVRDRIVRLFDKELVIADVVSEHTSKSINLPVYRIELNDGTELIMRNNFYDWKVSVKSNSSFNIPKSLVTEGYDNKIHKCYCEGFDESWIYGSYLDNRSNFTIEINGNYELFTLLFLLREQVEIRNKKLKRVCQE